MLTLGPSVTGLISKEVDALNTVTRDTIIDTRRDIEWILPFL